MKKIVICLLLNILLCSCPEEPGDEYLPHHKEVIWVINDCKENIYVSKYSDYYNVFYYPHDIEYWQSIAPSDSIYLELQDFAPEYPKYLVQVLILKQSTLNAYSFEEIEKNAIVDKRYILIKDRIIKDGGMRIIYNGED